MGEFELSYFEVNKGKNKAKYSRIKTDDETNILAFIREKNGKKVVYIANFSNNPIKTKVGIKGEFTNYMTGEKMKLNEKQIFSIEPWQYYILTEKN